QPHDGGVPKRVVCTDVKIKRILQGVYDSDVAGHRGIWSTYVRPRDLFIWGRMFESVQDYVCSCPTCRKFSEGKDRDTLALMIPTQLHRRWYIDIVATPCLSEGHVCYVEAREELSNFPEARALQSKRSEPVG
ncbi:MAG: hypothetical protein BJ554DRAFT_509, partial [Olpidium bornovanus]